MGQYWIIVNVSKKQFIDCYEFRVSKMMEFAWIGSDYILSIEAALSPGGIWYGDTVWFEGDYNEPNEDVSSDTNIYHVARESWECISVEGLTRHKRYVVNDNEKQYVDITKSESDIHPLPLLLANSSGGGGGDYRGSNEYLVGVWVGHHVYTSDEIPEGYEERTYQFSE